MISTNSKYFILVSILNNGISMNKILIHCHIINSWDKNSKENSVIDLKKTKSYFWNKVYEIIRFDNRKDKFIDWWIYDFPSKPLFRISRMKEVESRHIFNPFFKNNDGNKFSSFILFLGSS